MRAGLVVALGLVAACGTEPIVFDPIDGDAEGGVEAAPPPGMGCASDSDCALQTQHCETRSGQCVECVQSSQCVFDGDRPVCATALNLCVECNDNTECPDGTCELPSHRCVPSCADGGTCPYGYKYCNRMDVCIACTTSNDCMSARTANNLCDVPLGLCVECLDDGDCYAERPVCNHTRGRCVECLSNQGCRPSEACDPVMHVCVNPQAPDGGPRPNQDASFDGPFR